MLVVPMVPVNTILPEYNPSRTQLTRARSRRFLQKKFLSVLCFCTYNIRLGQVLHLVSITPTARLQIPVSQPQIAMSAFRLRYHRGLLCRVLSTNLITIVSCSIHGRKLAAYVHRSPSRSQPDMLSPFPVPSSLLSTVNGSF